MWSTSAKRGITIPFIYFILLLFFPILCLFCLPILLIRRCVSRLGQIFGGSSLGKMLTGSAACHGTSEEIGTCIASFTLQGIPDLNQIRAEFTDKVLHAKDSFGQFLYPELKQTVVSWGGYLFWKDVPDFQLPIRLLDVEQGVDLASPAGLELLQSFYGKEWKFGEGLLWELVIVLGLDGHFGLVFIIHHAMGDAFSLQKLIDKLSNPSIVGKKTGIEHRTNPCFTVRTLFLIPYDAALYLSILLFPEIEYCATSYEKNDNHITESLSGKLTLASTSLHLPDLKRIAKTKNVSVTAVIVSTVQGSLQKYWTENSILYFPTPDPKHPQKLRNVCGSGYVELVDNQGEAAKRLQKMEEQLQNFRTSTFPVIAQFFGTLFGCLPAPLVWRCIGGAAGNLTIFISTFIFSRHPFSIFGYPVLRVESGGAGVAGTKVVGIFIFSAGDSMSLTVTGDEAVVTDEQGKALLHQIVQEFKVLDNKESIAHVSVTISTEK